MARMLWLCPLVEHRLPQHWTPAIVALQDGPAGRFPCVWTTTDANRGRPWACGVAEVTEAGRTHVEAEARVQVFDAVTERFQALE